MAEIRKSLGSLFAELELLDAAEIQDRLDVIADEERRLRLLLRLIPRKSKTTNITEGTR